MTDKNDKSESLNVNNVESDNAEKSDSSNKIIENNNKTIDNDTKTIDNKTINNDKKTIDKDIKTIDNGNKIINNDTKSIDNDNKTIDNDNKTTENNNKTVENANKLIDNDTKKMTIDKNIKVIQNANETIGKTIEKVVKTENTNKITDSVNKTSASVTKTTEGVNKAHETNKTAENLNKAIENDEKLIKTIETPKKQNETTKKTNDVVKKTIEKPKTKDAVDKNESTCRMDTSSVLQIDTTDALDSYLNETKFESEFQIKDDASSTKIEPKINESSVIVKIEESQDETKENVKVIDVEPTKTNNINTKQLNSDENTNKTDIKDSRIKEKLKEMSKSLWVSNISRSCKASDLKEHLSKYGKVTTAKIVTDGSICFGYAVLEKPEEVLKCIENFNNTYFETKKITLSSKPPESVKETKEQLNKSETASLGSRSNRSRHENKRKPTPTLQNKSPNSRKTRSDLVREMEQMKRKILDEERRREERRREERQREKERDERRRIEMEYKLRDARKKLDMERQAIEKEKIALIKLQKMVADEERNKLKREKDNLKKEYKNLEAGLKRRKLDDRDYNNKKRIDDDRRWANDSLKPVKSSSSNDDLYNYKRGSYYHQSSLNKINQKSDSDKIYNLPPPPPKLTSEYEYRERMKHDIDDSYRKVNYIDGPRRIDVKTSHFDQRDHGKKMRYSDEYVRPKYPSAIGGFPNGKPEFMDGKMMGKGDGRSSSYISSDYIDSNKMHPSKLSSNSMYFDDWKGSVNRHHPPQFSSGYGGGNYYQDDGRYDFHGRKY